VIEKRESHLAQDHPIFETVNRNGGFGDEEKNTSVNCPDGRSYFCCCHIAIVCPG
jgi:hypothetical protein